MGEFQSRLCLMNKINVFRICFKMQWFDFFRLLCMGWHRVFLILVWLKKLQKTLWMFSTQQSNIKLQRIWKFESKYEIQTFYIRLMSFGDFVNDYIMTLWRYFRLFISILDPWDALSVKIQVNNGHLTSFQIMLNL